MTRPLRLEFENAWYHVMNRGAGRRDIFLTEDHRNKFLEIVSHAVNVFGIELHAYCLMSNHYHLFVKTPRGNLSQAMRHINGVYTQNFNVLEKTDGPLFRGRYKAIVVDGDSYLMQVSRYIHRNPLEAGMVKKLEKYVWSSYPGYLKPEKKLSWLHVDEIISMAGVNRPKNGYQGFVEEGLDEETMDFYNLAHTPVIFGNKDSKEQLLGKIQKKKIKSSLPDYRRVRALPTLKEISQCCADYFNVKEADLYQARRGRVNEPRQVAIYGSRMWGSGELADIAGLYGCHNHSSVSNTVRKISGHIAKSKKLAELIQEIQKRLGM